MFIKILHAYVLADHQYLITLHVKITDITCLLRKVYKNKHRRNHYLSLQIVLISLKYIAPSCCIVSI